MLEKIADRGPEYAALVELARPIIEEVVWEVVPRLAEALLLENLEKFANKS